ncbi:metallophosphoesterase family protein [Arsenicitalea aurantiaca]|nr:metallophosphoesterase [Arsenicitalea aurantiaca]
MTTLAHISDIHLAPLPPVPLRALFSKRVTGYLNWRMNREKAMSGEGLTNLVRHMREHRPDVTAVTGDLTNLALDAEINTAYNWLQTVGDPRSVCVSPGNHDAYVRGALEKALDRWGPYTRGETVDKSPFPFVRRHGELAVIVCSSAVPTAPLMARGEFDDAQAERLSRCLSLLGEAGYFRVVLIHHPPNLELRHPRLGLWGARTFRQVIAQQGAELILHGHTHKSSIYAVPGKTGDVPVVGVAAAAAAQSVQAGDDPARYNLFKVERHGSAWSCTMREFGFQRLSTDIVLRLQLRIY